MLMVLAATRISVNTTTVVSGQVTEVHELARRRWREFRGNRIFRADRTVFVQSTLRNCWIDLADYSLGAVPAKM